MKRGGTARHEAFILDSLLRAGTIDVEEVAKNLEVSPSTVRRRLRELQSRGLLRRTHGGAVAPGASLYEPFRYDESFQQQEALRSEEKRRIGLAAAALVKTGETIAISAGTTATQVARCLRHRSEITIVTNAINIAMELSDCPHLTVIVTGGFLSGNWFSLLGPQAIRSIEELFYDRAFIGLDGIHPEHGGTSRHPEEAALNRAISRQARQTVAVADHSKLGKIASAQICPLSEIDLLITDSGATDEADREFAERGLKIERA